MRLAPTAAAIAAVRVTTAETADEAALAGAAVGGIAADARTGRAAAICPLPSTLRLKGTIPAETSRAATTIAVMITEGTIIAATTIGAVIREAMRDVAASRADSTIVARKARDSAPLPLLPLQ